nr:MAG TPA: hypothetical protein [Caudoviricetes sp.]
MGPHGPTWPPKGGSTYAGQAAPPHRNIHPEKYLSYQLRKNTDYFHMKNNHCRKN